MQLTPRLLDHPFYQSWQHGTVTVEQLSRYAESYAELIAAMPACWERIGRELGADTSAVAADEYHHIALWQWWARRLPRPANAPRLAAALELCRDSSAAELLGAIHAFEVQQPEVARTKRDGLLAHYGFDAADLAYFDAHMDEAEHIAFGRALAATQDQAAIGRGFARGADVFYHALDAFVA